MFHLLLPSTYDFIRTVLPENLQVVLGHESLFGSKQKIEGKSLFVDTTNRFKALFFPTPAWQLFYELYFTYFNFEYRYLLRSFPIEPSL